MCGKGFSITTLLVVKSTITKFSSLCSPYKKLELFSLFKSTIKKGRRYIKHTLLFSKHNQFAGYVKPVVKVIEF